MGYEAILFVWYEICNIIKIVQLKYISIIDVTMIDVSSIKVDVSKDFGVHGI